MKRLVGVLESRSPVSCLHSWLAFYLFYFDLLKSGLLESNGGDEGCYTVSDLCTIPDGNLIAVAIQGQVSKHSAFVSNPFSLLKCEPVYSMY